MSYIAYYDEKRTSIKDFQKNKNYTIDDIKHHFYCPNKNCNAVLRIKQAKHPHFSVFTNTTPHTNICPYSSKNYRYFNISNYDEDRFNFEEICRNIINDSIIRDNKLVNTISKLYRLCINHEINFTYNNIPISRIMYDNRSAFLYTNNLNGYHLVATTFKYYDKKEETVILATIDNSYKIKLSFNNSTIFWETSKALYNYNKDLIILLGYFKDNETTIFNFHNQIYIPHKVMKK